MKMITRNKVAVTAECENCSRRHTIPLTDTLNPWSAASLDLKEAIKCECGEYHNLMVATTESPAIISNEKTDAPLKCPKCGSQQLHAGGKGFGLGKAAAGAVLLGPVGLLGGLLGSKKIMITCLSCGHKWQAGKS